MMNFQLRTIELYFFIKTRIKKPNSIYNKLQKMEHEFAN